MSSLIGRTPASSYKELLTINQPNGLNGALNLVSDGKGTATPLALSSTGLSIHGNIFPTNMPAAGAVLRMSTTTNQLEWVTLTTSDIAEGSNQYFTVARARAALTGVGDISVNASTGEISYTGSGGGGGSIDETTFWMGAL